MNTLDDAMLGTQYRNSRLRMQAIALTLSDEQAQDIVPACPDWTVRDLFSHVTGIASALGSGNGPSGDTQAWVDGQISERRSRSLSSVVDEWNTSAPAFEAMIDAVPKRLWGLTYDTIVHEHDLCNALRQQGERASSGVQMSAILGLRLVKGDLAKRSLRAFRAIIDGVEHIVGDGDPALTLTATSFESLRLLGSRRTLMEMKAAAFVGDLDGYLAGITHMDLPKASLGE